MILNLLFRKTKAQTGKWLKKSCGQIMMEIMIESIFSHSISNFIFSGLYLIHIHFHLPGPWCLPQCGDQETLLWKGRSGEWNQRRDIEGKRQKRQVENGNTRGGKARDKKGEHEE
jgi:hypothetical protein